MQELPQRKGRILALREGKIDKITFELHPEALEVRSGGVKSSPRE